MKNIIILFCFILLDSCSQKVDEFLFGDVEVTIKTSYFYEYKSNKLISKTEKNYTYYYGKVDSNSNKITYEYDKLKGNLIKEISNSYTKFYAYDSNDSLISEMKILSNGDTTILRKYIYYLDGQKLDYEKLHLPKYFDRNKSVKEFVNPELKDTIFNKNEYVYENNKCISLTIFNIKNQRTEIIEYEYIGDLKMKSISSNFFDSLKVFNKTRYYDYSKPIANYYSLDINNDTIEKLTNLFEGKVLKETYSFYDYGNILEKQFYKNNKLIGEINVDKKLNFRAKRTYDYYKNGDLKNEISQIYSKK